ncbi:uncharacterized protein LOC105179615 [Sesamum indicum]|uniref:S-protein homolog n=1 Tax=Sesamum indicum TaxID=4182 RepID=A0A6I9URQ5_SESIN|nr:uncharacterized protein LOC105179615 [Sesamum indicum]
MSPPKFFHTCLPFLLLSVLLQTNPSQQLDCVFTPQFTVRVTNNLPLYTGPLRLHCASKDDDLGFHSISLFGEFKWSFCDRFVGDTLFFCHLWWDARNGTKTKQFDVFKSEWSPRCVSRVCNWAANEDGVYFTGYNPPQQWQKRYNWENEAI